MFCDIDSYFSGKPCQKDKIGTDELLISLLKYEPDILALNETWIKEGEEALVPSIHQVRTQEATHTSWNPTGDNIEF
ncbi:unnamed protein product [Leptidea sinapis]|uniref:Endonuclease/exonuclease/phosphatase domain-containing protein n=1 Tax=Leptidea sinapis TaxID=189913 RepID=A0A5E4PPD5_9NEOP|nr:unnamed protein product [Leptidea sinapis]